MPWQEQRAPRLPSRVVMSLPLVALGYPTQFQRGCRPVVAARQHWPNRIVSLLQHSKGTLRARGELYESGYVFRLQPLRVVSRNSAHKKRIDATVAFSSRCERVAFTIVYDFQAIGGRGRQTIVRLDFGVVHFG